MINEKKSIAEKNEVNEAVVYTSLKFKVPEIGEGLTRFFRSHCRFLLTQNLDMFDIYNNKVGELEVKIAEYLLLTSSILTTS